MAGSLNGLVEWALDLERTNATAVERARIVKILTDLHSELIDDDEYDLATSVTEALKRIGD